MGLKPQNSVDGLWHNKDFVYDIYKLDVHLVIENLTLGSTRVCVTELVKEFVLVTVMPVRKFTFCLRVPLVLFVLFVGAEWDLELFVLVSDVSHGSVFGLVRSVAHNCMQIVEVLLTVFCLLSSIF